MKKIFILMAACMLAQVFISNNLVYAQEQPSAVIVDNMGNNNSILLQVRDLSLVSPQQYFANCYVISNESDYGVAYVNQPSAADVANDSGIINVMVNGLKSGTAYRCEAGVATPSNGGYSISRSSSKVDVNTLGSATPSCQSTYVLYNNQCVYPIPACKNPIENSVSCFDKIDNGQYIEHYNFSCLSGYTKSGDRCISTSTTTASNAVIADHMGNNNSILLQVRDLSLVSPQQYFANCYVISNESDYGVAYVNQPSAADVANDSGIINVMVNGLKSGTAYRCEAGVATPSNGGYSISRSSSKVDVNTLGNNTGSATANQKPSITTATYSIDTNVPKIGTKFTFTAGGQDPENDNYKMKFWVCKLDGTICNNAMNGSAEEWTYGNQFVWKALDGGKYQLHVIIVDGHHAGTDSPFGDNQYILPFEVYGNPTTVTPSTTSSNPTPTSDNTSNANNATSSTASGATAAHTPSIPKAGYEDEVLTTFDSNPFSDTNITSDSGKAAAELYRRGVIGGYADGEFKGSRQVNRAEAAKFLLLARYGTVDELSNSGKFWDVLDGQWYTKFVVQAANLGIINGYGDGSFKPASTVSVAEFLKMLTKTFSLQENLPYSYTDVQSTDWFAPYAGIAQKYNLFPNHQTKLMPQTLLARDEVALAIYQYLKNR
jgi:hypothetical protein